MYFGIGPFGLGFNFGQQAPPRVPQMFNQQQAPPRQPQNNNGGGLFGGLNNFLNTNFMNPFMGNEQERANEQRRQEEPRPSFSRKANRQESRPFSPKKEEKYSENTGMYWKIKGNEAFQSGKLEQAIKYYTKAIELNNSESVFYSNRAQCFKKLGKIDEALKDAQESIELDPTNIRGHMLAGQVLAETGKQEDNIRKVENSIVRLTKALTLCGGKKIDIQKEISRYIYLAKKVLFYLQFNLLRNSRIQAINEYKEYLDHDDRLDAETKEKKMQDFLNASNERVAFVVPEYLQCKITFDLMEDPVVTDSGHTYERSAIEEHMQHNGKTDPFTRQPIKGPLYPSVAIKKAIQEFLERNPWAYEYSEGENYKDITF